VIISIRTGTLPFSHVSDGRQPKVLQRLEEACKKPRQCFGWCGQKAAAKEEKPSLRQTLKMKFSIPWDVRAFSVGQIIVGVVVMLVKLRVCALIEDRVAANHNFFVSRRGSTV
jgi:hypothetical protein